MIAYPLSCCDYCSQLTQSTQKYIKFSVKQEFFSPVFKTDVLGQLFLTLHLEKQQLWL